MKEEPSTHPDTGDLWLTATLLILVLLAVILLADLIGALNVVG